MKTLKFSIMIIALAMLFGAKTGAAIAAPVATALDPVDVEQFIDEIVQDQLGTHHVAGATVSVVQANEIIFIEGYGYADIEREIEVNPSTTMFQVASVTKLFTWTAVMQQVEAGKLDLDADINTYLDFSIPATYDKPITLRHLMTHSAGFEDRAFGMMAASPETIQSLGTWLKTHIPERIYAPGDVIAYSNYGAALAGYIVERSSGQPIEAYLEDHIFVPLGMRHSSIQQPLPAQYDLAHGYTYYNGIFNAKPAELDQAAPAGALSTSAEDMAFFMMAHLQGSQGIDTPILEASTVEVMHAQALSYDTRSNGMALGFIEMDRNGQTVVGHDGNLMYSHGLMVLLPDQNLGLFVSYNSAHAGDMPKELFHAFMDRYYPRSEDLHVDTNQDISRFAGHYQWSRQNASTSEKIESLFSNVSFIVSDSGTLRSGNPNSPLEMLMVDDLLFQDIYNGATMAFVTDEQGDILYASHSEWPDMVLIRQQWYQTDGLHKGVLFFSMSVYLLTLIGLLGRTVTHKIRRTDPGEKQALWLAPVITILTSVALIALFVSLFDNYINLLQGTIPITAIQSVSIVVVLSTLISVATTIILWKQQLWLRIERIAYSGFAVLALLFVSWLAYWNLLWIRF